MKSGRDWGQRRQQPAAPVSFPRSGWWGPAARAGVRGAAQPGEPSAEPTPALACGKLLWGGSDAARCASPVGSRAGGGRLRPAPSRSCSARSLVPSCQADLMSSRLHGGYWSGFVGDGFCEDPPALDSSINFPLGRGKPPPPSLSEEFLLPCFRLAYTCPHHRLMCCTRWCLPPSSASPGQS